MGRFLVIVIFLAGLIMVPRWVLTHPDRQQLESMQEDVERLTEENVERAAHNRRLLRQAESIEDDLSYQREVAKEHLREYPSHAIRIRFQ